MSDSVHEFFWHSSHWMQHRVQQHKMNSPIFPGDISSEIWQPPPCVQGLDFLSKKITQKNVSRGGPRRKIPHVMLSLGLRKSDGLSLRELAVDQVNEFTQQRRLDNFRRFLRRTTPFCLLIWRLETSWKGAWPWPGALLRVCPSFWRHHEQKWKRGVLSSTVLGKSILPVGTRMLWTYSTRYVWVLIIFLIFYLFDLTVPLIGCSLKAICPHRGNFSR